MNEYYVLEQKNTFYRVSATSSERAKGIVVKRPSITSSGNVLQAFGVDPNDESLSTLYMNLPNTVTAYKVGNSPEPVVEYDDKELEALKKLIEFHAKHKINNEMLSSLWSLRSKLLREKKLNDDQHATGTQQAKGE